jgi:endonuclease/exonuclease/phosphatase (EEP) superfamily protein YafD
MEASVGRKQSNKPLHTEPRAARFGEINVVCRGPVNGGVMTSTTDSTRQFFRLSVRPWGLLIAAGVVACGSTVVGFAGRYSWICDLFSHFRAQYALALSVLGIALLLGRHRRTAAAFATFAALNVVAILPSYVCIRARPPVPSGSQTFRAMLINVNTNAGNPSQVAAVIRQYDPDVLVLVEISSRWIRELSWLADAYPHQCVEPRSDNFGIGLYSKFPLRDHKIAIIGEASVPSVLATAALGERLLHLIATHPLPPGGAENSRLRNDQLERLPDFVRRDAPTLLLGDLNTTPWNHYFKRLLRDSGLIDSSCGRWIQPSWPSFAPLCRIPIDHCLHSPDVVILQRSVSGDAGSDHFPLVVDGALVAPSP